MRSRALDLVLDALAEPIFLTDTEGVITVANTVALTLKGVTGDTGILMSLTQPTVLTFPGTPSASFVITAASLTTGVTAVIFF